MSEATMFFGGSGRDEATTRASAWGGADGIPFGGGAVDETKRTMPGANEPGALGCVDNYILKKKIGGGGFGVVYLVEDSFSHVQYAFKTIHPALKQNPEEMQRLKENFAIVQKLHDEHIADARVIHIARDVQYFSETAREDLRLSPGDPVIVMSYAPGSTLSAWRESLPSRRVPVAQAVEICNQVAKALDYAHKQHVVHRDVKPANVIVSFDQKGRPDVKVLDFGLAAEMRSSLGQGGAAAGHGVKGTSGTRPYMAPEQWVGEDQDGRTDQYALAVMLYELVSGAVPFEGVFRTGDVALMADAVRRRPPLSLSVLSPSQNRALRKALAKAPADRFRSCQAFMAAFSGTVLPSGLDEGGDKSLRDMFRASLARLVPFFRACGDAAAGAARRVVCAAADRHPRLRALLDRAHLLPESFFEPEAGDVASVPSSGGVAETRSRAGAAPRVPVVTPVDLGGGLSFDMADLPPGVFTMGSPHSEPGRKPGESLHEVSLSPFQLAAAPVTRGKWRAVMGEEPPAAGDAPAAAPLADDLPVTGVSWDDCQAFLARLNAAHAITGYEWRLPTEAQWEYACRAGSSGPYAGTGRIEDMGWYSGNSEGAPHPVRLKQPNAWGLHDMHGGVWEWCADPWVSSLGNAPAVDPVAQGDGRARVARGGSWAHSAALARSASRFRLLRSSRFDNVGFRVALVPR